MVSAGADRLPRSEEKIFVRRTSSPSDGTSRRQSYSVHRHYRQLSANCNGFDLRFCSGQRKYIACAERRVVVYCLCR